VIGRHSRAVAGMDSPLPERRISLMFPTVSSPWASRWILSGAALQRCDNWLIFSIGFTDR
jgi:hypothetical protein